MLQPLTMPFFTEMDFVMPFGRETVKARANVWGVVNDKILKLDKVEITILEASRQKQLKDKDFIKEIKSWAASQYFTMQVAGEMMKFVVSKY